MCGSLGLPWRLHGKASPANAGDAGLIPGLGRAPGGHGSHSKLLPGEPQGQSSLVGYRPRGPREPDTTEAAEHACAHVRPSPPQTAGFSL